VKIRSRRLDQVKKRILFSIEADMFNNIHMQIYEYTSFSSVNYSSIRFIGRNHKLKLEITTLIVNFNNGINKHFLDISKNLLLRKISPQQGFKSETSYFPERK